MKQLITVIVLCSLGAFSMGQTVYESPCVVDGKTFQVTIPEEFFKVEMESVMRTSFSTKEVLNPNFGSKELGEMAVGNIVIYYEVRNNRSLESYGEEIGEGSNEVNASFKIVTPPKIDEINGREILFTELKAAADDVDMNAFYLAVFPYGERIVKVGYVSTEKLTEFMGLDEFKEIFTSLKEVETSEKDCKYVSTIAEIHEMFAEELDVYMKYENDLFVTNLSRVGIMPIFDSNWKEQLGASTHLLEEYIYKKNNGRIQIFSGGRIENYTENREMELAIQKVMESADKPKITYDSNYSSDYNTFKKYSVSGANTVSLVYTAEIENELVFFLIDEGPNPVSDFKSAAHDYIMIFSFMNEGDIAPPARSVPVTPPPPPTINGGH